MMHPLFSVIPHREKNLEQVFIFGKRRGLRLYPEFRVVRKLHQTLVGYQGGS
jgi:hypothetical protein